MKRTLQPLLIWPAPEAGAASVLKPNHAASNLYRIKRSWHTVVSHYALLGTQLTLLNQEDFAGPSPGTFHKS